MRVGKLETRVRRRHCALIPVLVVPRSHELLIAGDGGLRKALRREYRRYGNSLLAVKNILGNRLRLQRHILIVHVGVTIQFLDYFLFVFAHALLFEDAGCARVDRAVFGALWLLVQPVLHVVADVDRRWVVRGTVQSELLVRLVHEVALQLRQVDVLVVLAVGLGAQVQARSLLAVLRGAHLRGRCYRNIATDKKCRKISKKAVGRVTY